LVVTDNKADNFKQHMGYKPVPNNEPAGLT
jgi:hypothetical protein